MTNSDKVFCRGSDRLKELIVPLSKIGIVPNNYSISTLNNVDRIFFPRETGVTWASLVAISEFLNCGYKEITPEEFKAFYITHGEVESKSYIGFRGDPSVDISLIPKEIIPSNFRFSLFKSDNVVFFYDRNLKQLDYATSQIWSTLYVNVVKFADFLKYLDCLMGTNTSMQSPVQKLDISEESTKPEKLKLSNINTFKIVL